MLPLTRFFHPVLPSSSLREDRPAGVRIVGRGFALFRDSTGTPAAVADLCPHCNASLSGAGRVREGRIVCGYDGWSFDLRGAGRCLSQPSLQKCDTESFQVIERFGYLWLADRGVPLDRFPGIGWEGFQFAGSLTHLFECSLPTALDNFSEDFPTVHWMFDSGLSRVEFEAENFGDRTEVRYAGPHRGHRVLLVFGVKAGDRYLNEWVTRFEPLHKVYTFRWESPRGEARPLSVRSAVFMVPETDVQTRFHVFVFVNVASGSLWRRFLPAVNRAALLIGRREVVADARIVRHPDSLDCSRLAKLYKSVIHNRKLLDALYFGAPGPVSLRSLPRPSA